MHEPMNDLKMEDYKGSAWFSYTKDSVFIWHTLTTPIEISRQNESDEIVSDMNQTLWIRGGNVARHR
jgi:hypothetical protein